MGTDVYVPGCGDFLFSSSISFFSNSCSDESKYFHVNLFILAYEKYCNEFDISLFEISRIQIIQGFA